MHIIDLTRFLAELSDNNERAWFAMNQPRYDILRAEFLQLVTGLISDIGRFDPAVVDCNPKKALFRFHRDLRFSHNKQPYKTTFSAAITASGLRRPSQSGGPMYYFQINAIGMLTIAAGEYAPPADRLRAIRQQLIADPEGFTKVLKNRKLRSSFGDLRQKDKLMRLPKRFAADAPHADYLRHKSFVVAKEMTLTPALRENLAIELVNGFRDAYPLVAWLRTANSH